MDISQIVGLNLRRLRTERNLSLGQLAELSEVSKVMLSQIEKGETNPTINTIWKIANGLKVPYTALLEQPKREAAVVKKSEIGMQADSDGHYRVYCYYENTPVRNFELFQIELDAGCSFTSTGHAEKLQEYILVLEGELTLTVDGQSHTLGPDESICFTASGSHTYLAGGERNLRAVVINFYPV